MKNNIIQQKNTEILAETTQDVDVQITTAKRYPRSMERFAKAVRESINFSTEVAESCYYVVPRKPEDIVGPSIRLAEIIVNSWENLVVGTRVKHSKDGKTVCSEGVAWDLEKNVKVTQEVERSIVSKNGQIYSENMRQVTQMAANSIAYRNVVFKVIPRCFIDGFCAEAKNIVQEGAKNIMKLKKAIAKLTVTMGMDEKHLLEILNRESISAIRLEDYATIVGIGNAINSGDFDVKNEKHIKIASKGVSGTSALIDKIKKADESIEVIDNKEIELK